MIEPLEMTEQTERELGARLDSLAGSGAAQRFLAGLREKADGKLRTLNFSPALLARMAGQALAFRLTVPALAAEIARLAPAATAPGASGAASAAPAWCYDPRRPAEEVGALMPLAKQEYLKDLHARQNYALAQLGQTVQPAPEITFDSVAQRVSSAALETACEMNERKIAALTARHKPAAPTGPTAKESAQAVWNEYQGLRGLERAEFFHARESELAEAVLLIAAAAAGIVTDHRQSQ